MLTILAALRRTIDRAFTRWSTPDPEPLSWLDQWDRARLGGDGR